VGQYSGYGSSSPSAPKVMPLLQDLLDDLISGDEARAEAAVPLLIDVGTDATTALKKMSKSKNVDARWWSVRTFGQSPQCPIEWLTTFLIKDPAPEVRQCAALVLSMRPDEKGTQSLVQALSDDDGMVVSLAVKALVNIGESAVPLLIQTVENSRQSARIHAMRALAEICDHRAIPVMMRVMGEDSSLLQYWAKEGLERLGLDMVYIKPV